jgi:acetyl-CoA carboxylase biotin carboxyl carrier protein
MSIDEIRELIALFNESGVGELEVQRGDNRVRLKRAQMSQEVMMPALAAPAYAPQAMPQMVAAGAAAATPAPVAEKPRADEKYELVKSPIVGTFYESSSPGAAPFVKVGDAVEKGQVLCIIESMKLMNEIESEIAGTIVTKLVDNGKPVEYGQALFAIQPR